MSSSFGGVCLAMADKPQIYLPKNQKRKGSNYYPTTQEEWVSFINECHDEKLNDRKKHELQWAANIAYAKGYQDLVFDPQTGLMSFFRERALPIIINRIGPFIEARHAKLTKNRPVGRVIPNTKDIQDKRAAQYSDQALMHLWRSLGMEAVYDRLVMMMLQTGTAFVENVWDPLGGDELTDLKTVDDELFLEDDGSDFQEEKIWQGEISSKALSSFSMLPCHSNIPDIKDQPYMIKRVHLPIVKLEGMYPHLKGKLSADDKLSSKTEYERLVDRLQSPSFNSYGSDLNNSKYRDADMALVKVMAVAPNHEYEKGLIGVVIGSELAMMDVFPNDYGTNVYPWVKFSEKEDPYSFWPQSTIERLIPVQKSINIIKQKKLKNAILMANVKWMLAKGSQVSEEALTDEEGEVIEWNSLVPAPAQAVIAPLPQYVQQFDEELKTDFRDVGGQRETSATPGNNLTASVSMQMQAELSDEIINPLIRRLGRGMEIVSGQHLLLMDQEWLEQRKIKVVGNDGKIAVQYLSNADFRHHHDVHIEIESLFPDFRGAKKQTLLELWDRRVITDPQKLIRALRFGDLDQLLEESEKIEDAIELDIAKLKKGKMPEFHPFQNHSLYAQKLIEYMNTPEFLRLIPERKQQAIAYTQQHLQFLMQSMPGGGEPMAQTNQAAMGTPSGPAKPVGAE